LYTVSEFFIPAQLPEWCLSIEDYKLAETDPIYRYKYLTCVFPLLENCIRRIFAFANKAPERILIAGKLLCFVFNKFLLEATELMTTIDTLLDERLENNSPNRVVDDFGKQIMFMLLDIFFWEDGPRLRDIISHGAIDPVTIPFYLVQRTLLISVNLGIKYINSSQRGGKECKFPLLMPLCRIF
jgi:hypothetical protein